jgi:hypothetical protein
VSAWRQTGTDETDGEETRFHALLEELKIPRLALPTEILELPRPLVYEELHGPLPMDIPPVGRQVVIKRPDLGRQKRHFYTAISQRYDTG